MINPYAFGGGGGGSGGTWNIADVSAAVFTLSESGIRATQTSNGAADAMIRATTGHASGKFYFELEVMSYDAVNTSLFLGICGPGAITGGSWTALTDQLIWRNSGSVFQDGTSNPASYASYTTGDVLGFAVDATAKTAQFFKNNVSQGAAITYTPASVKPFMVATGSFAGDSVRLRSGPGNFTYTPPGGFASWD